MTRVLPKGSTVYSVTRVLIETWDIKIWSIWQLSTWTRLQSKLVQYDRWQTGHGYNKHLHSTTGFNADTCTTKICTVRQVSTWTRLKSKWVQNNARKRGNVYHQYCYSMTGNKLERCIIIICTILTVLSVDTCIIKIGSVSHLASLVRVQSKLVQFDPRQNVARC